MKIDNIINTIVVFILIEGLEKEKKWDGFTKKALDQFSKEEKIIIYKFIKTREEQLDHCRNELEKEYPQFKIKKVHNNQKVIPDLGDDAFS